MAFKSKYTGPQVEGLLDQMASGCITVETDPIFSASPVFGITENNILEWNNKVDKVDGKQLSTEDFTTILKQKLEGLSNYDDAAINQALQGLQTQVNTLVSGNASVAIESFNEIVAFLDGITDSQDLDSIIASIEQQIAGKMDNVTLAAVATSGSYNDLSNKPFESITYYGDGVNGVTADGGAFTIPTIDGSGYIKSVYGIESNYEKVNLSTIGIRFITGTGEGDWEIHNRGDGTKYLSDDGTYKTISEGGGTNKKVVLTSDEEMILKPNEVVVVFTMISNLTITGFENTPWNDNLDLEENGAAFYDEYTVIFNNTIGSSFTLTMPDSVLWANGEMPQIDNGYYELSITRMAFESPDNNVYKAVLTQFK